MRLLDREFRVPATGQYLDAIDLAADRQVPGKSSIAATGIGLISLAMADALGIDGEAAEKAQLTLLNLLNRDPKRRFRADRSAGGWFEQYLDSETGAVFPEYRGQFSTIDTSLLAIGAVFAGRYFDGKKSGPNSAPAEVAKLSGELLGSIAWSNAVRDLRAGRLHALFIGQSEASFPTYWGELFDEYVLLPCLGRYVDKLAGRKGPLSEYWDRHVADIDRLPTKMFGGVSVLSHTKDEFVSHFTHQFGFYLCSGLAKDPRYQRALAGLRDADQQWFAQHSGGFPDRWWGLGAGSALVWNDVARTSATEQYVASTLAHGGGADTFSPPIMAGFLALDALDVEAGRKHAGGSPTLANLRALFARGECVYRYRGLTFLWRCSGSDPFRRVRYVQGIDFSTYMFGMATMVPELGLDFFRRYAP